MNKKMIFGVLALVLVVGALTGCCNRCKNTDAYGLPAGSSAAGSGEPAYIGSADSSSGARQAIK